MTTTDAASQRHRPWEDGMAILLGSACAALGLGLYEHAHILIGSTAGIALLISYATGWSFGPVFFVVNLPFYWLAWQRVGHQFTFKTFAAIALLSWISWYLSDWIEIGEVAPLFAALMGGALIGLGALALFRHRGSLGGFNILALYVQDRHGWRAGNVQMGLDGLVMLAAFFVLPAGNVLYSILGAVVLAVILTFNHRPGRYTGVSSN
ncbi:putative 5xTM membrane YitT family protein [Kushneria sinocarnis]|uniref:Putative 5xTM membrane YitT family protein n=1 Tax=Kushneria sinocarnis TaxID=595502 RepID=A0A420WXL9_9GAMM|nr:YitT family protein [Kushneria sinocarnis]RKR04511.1 putative 5xTM membrane YitT family protein [Kushneria sinocarnis]